jgi:6-phosphofructokinase
MSNKKGVIGILTGGGDVPGLNPAIRAVTIRALREGYQVIGVRRGWLGPISIVRDEHADNSEHFQVLTEEIVNRAGRTGGTFLHTSRTNPSAVKKKTCLSRCAQPTIKTRTISPKKSSKTWIGWALTI